ncbi:HAMP domain-containing sensor histidine kinase [soil metagenome]
MVLLAGATVTVVLLVTTLLWGTALRAALVEDVTEATVAHAQQVAGLAGGGNPSPALPVLDDDAFALVVRDGVVVAASAGAFEAEVGGLPDARAGELAVHEVSGLAFTDDRGAFIVAVLRTEAPQGVTTVYTGRSLEDVNDAMAAAAGVAAVGLPIVVTVLAAAMWLVVGRTLDPVERIRAEAEALGVSELHRRVPASGRDDEIGRLAHTLNAMLARLESSFEQQRRFVADAAHELRTPVANLRAQLEIARAAGSDADWDTRSLVLLEDTLRIQRLIEQLLLLARLDAGRTVAARPVDLDDVVMSVAGRLANCRAITLDLEGIEPVQIGGDPTLVEQLVVNLLDNAMRHADQTVRITTGPGDGGGAFLQVEDDGRGIPAHRRDQVLHRFTRLEDARDRDSGGLGLGLAIAADIAHAHAGEIEVGASDLGGARLRVLLGL